MVALALLSSALAYLIYFRLIARAGATNALIVTFLLPVSADPCSASSWLDEILDAQQIAGMAAICHRRRRHRRPAGAIHCADAAPLNS